MKYAYTLLLVCALAVTGCSDMTQGQQRVLSGAAIGTAGGAVLGAIGGNAALGAVAGGVAGVAGGLIYNEVKKNEQNSYNQGYAAGQRSSQ
jgi:osmotically inducible lipoprotein OsmB